MVTPGEDGFSAKPPPLLAPLSRATVMPAVFSAPTPPIVL
jgi:hypothetical protein